MTAKQKRAFSYSRISSAEQAKGFGLERQLDYARKYCERNGLILDDQTFVDAGVSGYSGANALAGELGAFIALVHSGHVPKGSVLLIENLDRFTRMPPAEATALISNVVRAGVEVHTIAPEQKFTRSNISDFGTWLPLQVAVCLSHEESRKKSDRGRDNWARKRTAIASGTKFGNTGPFWLELESDRRTWRVIPKHAEAVRKMFALAIDGFGQSRIAKELNHLYPNGPTGKGWQPPVIGKVLRGRAVLGELVVCTQEKVTENDKVKLKITPAGAPVENYYPAVIDETTYYKAQGAVSGRKRTGGRRTNWTNLFGGLLVDTRDGEKMVTIANKRSRRYCSAGALKRKAGSAFLTIPVGVIEGAILSKLPELKARDLTGGDAPVSDADEWSAKLSAVNHKIKLTQDRAAKADDPTVFLDLLAQYGTERGQIVTELETAKASAASPASAALEEAQEVAELLASARPEEVGELRARLRAALARLVERIEVTILTQGRARRVGLKVAFRAGGFRTYCIHFQHPKWEAWTYRANSALTDPPWGTMTSGTISV